MALFPSQLRRAAEPVEVGLPLILICVSGRSVTYLPPRLIRLLHRSVKFSPRRGLCESSLRVGQRVWELSGSDEIAPDVFVKRRVRLQHGTWVPLRVQHTHCLV